MLVVVVVVGGGQSSCLCCHECFQTGLGAIENDLTDLDLRNFVLFYGQRGASIQRVRLHGISLVVLFPSTRGRFIDISFAIVARSVRFLEINED